MIPCCVLLLVHVRSLVGSSLTRLGSEEAYLTESLYNVVLQKSIPGQNRQLILHITNMNNDSTDF